MRAQKRTHPLLFALLLGTSVATYAQSLTEQAAAHIEAGRYAAAYQMLSPQ